MKARTAILSTLVMAMLFASTAWALDQVPHELNVQGVLRNAAGEVVTGSYDIKISLYATQNATTALYTETFTNYNVVGGVFDVYLGPMNNIFKNRSEMWLGIQVNSDDELPRVRVTSVAYAFQAEHAEQADELLGPATDVNCSGCIGQSEVDFPWALGVSAGGDAAGLTCTGCVSGGNNGDIGSATITSYNLANGAVGTNQLANGAVTNAKLGPDAVTSDKIKDGEVKTNDLAAGAVTSAKIANGAVGNAQLNVNYASSDTKGGPANGLECSGCVSGGTTGDIGGATITSYNLANGAVGTNQLADGAVTSAKIKDGTITGNDIANNTISGSKLVNGTITNTQLGVNYAGSDSKGGPALDLKCASACVSSSEVAFNYAGSSSKGGAANDSKDLHCTGCVSGGGSGDIASKTITEANLADGAVTSQKIANGGVATVDLANGAVTPAKLAASCNNGEILKMINGSWQCAADAGGTTYTQGWGITITGSEIAVNKSQVLARNEDWPLAHGKKIQFVNADGTAEMFEATSDGDNNVEIRMNFGGSAAAANEMFSIYDSQSGARTHFFTAAGNTYHKGDMTIDGVYHGNGSGLTHVNADRLDGKDSTDFVFANCTGCVSSKMIADGTVATADLAGGAVTNAKIANATIDKSKLSASNCSAGQILKLNGSGAWVCSADAGGTTYTGGWGITVSGSTISANTDDLDSKYVDEGEANAITSGMIRDGQVQHADLAANSVSSGNIIDGQVATADLANNAVTSGKIKDGEVKTADLANGAVTNAKLANGSVTTAKLANSAVTSAKIKDGTIATADIADGAVTLAKLHAGCSNNQIIRQVNGAWACSSDNAGVTGHGTPGYLPKWTGSTTLSNSAVSDNGSRIILHSRDLDVGTHFVRHVKGITLDWTGSYDGINHGLFSYLNGSYTDSITLNSYNDVEINLDTNNNNSDSYFQIRKHTTGTAGTFLFKVSEAGSVIMAGNAYVYGKNIFLPNSYTQLSQGTGHSLRVTTKNKNSSGNLITNYVEIGSQNPSWIHFVSNSPPFYFNKSISVAGNLYSYGNGSHNLGSNSDRWNYLYVNHICLSGVCKTSWPNSVTSSGGSSPHIPLWTGSTTLGNSILTQDSTGVHWGTASYLSTDQGGSIELGGTGTPFIDFKNDTSSDYDMRIILSGNDLLTITGGDTRVSALQLGNSNTRLFKGANNSLQVQTNSGYIQIGPQNSSWSQFYTDRPAYYFNKRIYIAGNETADNWTDRNHTGCRMDPDDGWKHDGSSETILSTLNAFNAYVTNGFHAAHGYFWDGLKVNHGIQVYPANSPNGGSSWGGAIVVYNSGNITPSTDGSGSVGWYGYNDAGRRKMWYYMTAYNTYFPSDRTLKKDITDLDDQDLDWALNAVRKAELAFWWYKVEHRTPTKEDAMHYRPVPHIGAIAQSLPDVVKAPGSNLLSMGDMIGLNMTAIRAVDRNTQRLQAKVRNLQAKVDYLTRILVSRGLITQDQIEEMNQLVDSQTIR